ncbi:hypothetical protein HPB51_023211 [Rhipicephalus microplus]|uniref:Uncharacterized protein n=1 Tax=Rhipicephalus microplus TaxID=6941 RepID=A0A9J6DJP2_RHIMP|nr:hypothetical protein HPB51_023211 [Rhipicephalus microplus]
MEFSSFIIFAFLATTSFQRTLVATAKGGKVVYSDTYPCKSVLDPAVPFGMRFFERWPQEVRAKHMSCHNITAQEALERDRSYDEHKAKCMAAVLPSVEASMREKDACRIVMEATNMSSAAFWTVTQLDLESKRALCLREALPDTPEAERAVAFRRAAQEANALTKRHTDLRQKGSGNFGHLRFFNVQFKLSTQESRNFTLIENVTTVAETRSRNLRVGSSKPFSLLTTGGYLLYIYTYLSIKLESWFVIVDDSGRFVVLPRLPPRYNNGDEGASFSAGITTPAPFRRHELYWACSAAPVPAWTRPPYHSVNEMAPNLRKLPTGIRSVRLSTRTSQGPAVTQPRR